MRIDVDKTLVTVVYYWRSDAVGKVGTLREWRRLNTPEKSPGRIGLGALTRRSTR